MKIRITQPFTTEVQWVGAGGAQLDDKEKRKFLPGTVLEINFLDEKPQDGEGGTPMRLVQLPKEEGYDGIPQALFPCAGFIEADKFNSPTIMDVALAACVQLYAISRRKTWREGGGKNKMYRKTKTDLERDEARAEGSIYAVCQTFPSLGDYNDVLNHVISLAISQGLVYSNGNHKDDPYKEKVEDLPAKGQDYHKVRMADLRVQL